MLTHLLLAPGLPSNCFTSNFNGSVGGDADSDLFTRTEWDASLGALNGAGAIAYDSKDVGTHLAYWSRWRYNSSVGQIEGDKWDVELSWSTSYYYSPNSGSSYCAFIGFSQSATSVSTANIVGLFAVAINNPNTIRYYVLGAGAQPPTSGPVINTEIAPHSGKLRVVYRKGAADETNMDCYYMTDGVDTEWQFLVTRSITRTAVHYLHFGFASGTVSTDPEIRGHTSEITRIHTLDEVNVDCPSP